MSLKITALGFVFTPIAYLKDPWNILDFCIVLAGYATLIFVNSGISLAGLRALRVLRPLRTISNIKELKRVLTTLFGALPLIKDVIIIFVFFYTIMAIAGLSLFSGMLKKRCYS